MVALTNAEKQKAHRRRMAEKMARYEGALLEIKKMDWFKRPHEIAAEALNPTELAKS